jgi:myo-inositol 2-dehydrogenase / D-chiro-inositol 1-dehydrogenase
MSNKSKIGLIGTGRIGHVHAANIASLPEITLRRLCDPVARATAQQREGSGATADPSSPGLGDDRATLIPTDAALRSTAKDRSIDVDPNA